MADLVSVRTISKTPLSGRLDLLQSLSGVILAFFVLVHLCFVSTILLGPSIMDGLGWLLEELYLVQIFGPLLFLLMIFHFLLAARKMPFTPGGLTVYLRHAREMRHQGTWEWLLQVATAIVVLVLASIHMYEALSTLPITAEQSALREQGGWTPFYMVLLVCGGIHLTLGLFRVGIKFGYVTQANRAKWQRRTYILLAAYIALGIITTLRFHYLAV